MWTTGGWKKRQVPNTSRKGSVKSKNFSPANFQTKLRDVDWGNLLSVDNPSVAVGHLTEILTNILDKTAPKKRIQVKKNYAQWVSVSTLEKMNFRDQLRKSAERTGEVNSWIVYRKCRNMCQKLVKADKRECLKLKIEGY